MKKLLMVFFAVTVMVITARASNTLDTVSYGGSAFNTNVFFSTFTYEGYAYEVYEVDSGGYANTYLYEGLLRAERESDSTCWLFAFEEFKIPGDYEVKVQLLTEMTADE